MLKIVTGKPVEKASLESPRCRWQGNITMDPIEIHVSMRKWVDSAPDRDYWRTLVNAALNLGVP